MSDDLVEVRMVTQMSGPRGDGSDWPAPGATLWVPEEEAAALTRNPNPASPPIAVRVDRPKVETAAPAPVAETRPGPTEDEQASAEPPAELAAEPPVKRGPGRPPGSTSKPRA